MIINQFTGRAKEPVEKQRYKDVFNHILKNTLYGERIDARRDIASAIGLKSPSLVTRPIEMMISRGVLKRKGSKLILQSGVDCGHCVHFRQYKSRAFCEFANLNFN